ncbi:hypothetical protein O7627_11795 [Solwaraspora sp. WMMD1047]|uniref:hypothetical protein n=1 Tax=Solwaraspora sp. WMMD1047 TaxID=3016102 RepID=UPI002415B40E|nr:hypothetical protein [Solwaraspora sp. WMMD1047]MDG4829981.1 hypothetical protein [Solwaraspora sp. WMMD1047]
MTAPDNPATTPGKKFEGEPVVFYCRTCRRALNQHTSAGRLTFHHAAEMRGGTVDHPAVPVPLTELADPLIECDFCSAPDAAWIYLTADRATDVRKVTSVRVNAADYRDRHRAARVHRVDTAHAFTQQWGQRWTACHGCATLIDQRDLYALISRVSDAMPAKMRRGNRLARLRGQLHSLYSDLFATLTPGRGGITPGHPLGIWPDPSDGAP